MFFVSFQEHTKLRKFYYHNPLIAIKQLYVGLPSTKMYRQGFENLEFGMKNLEEPVSMHVDLIHSQPRKGVHINNTIRWLFGSKYR